MAQDKEPLIIVEETPEGLIEHEFPPDMDPAKAAAIVRNSKGPVKQGVESPQSLQNNPGNYWDGVAKSIGETAVETAKGVGSGVVSTLNPMNIIRFARDAGKMVYNPYEFYQEQAAATPARIEAIKKVISGDPRAGGEAIGGLATALVAPPVARSTIKLAPQYGASRALMRGAGSVIESTGKTMAWPLRVGGVAKLAKASHSPLGAAAGATMMAIPEAIEATGVALRRAGTSPGTVLLSPEGRLARIVDDIEAAKENNPEALARARAELDALRRETTDEFSTSRDRPEDKAFKSLEKRQKKIVGLTDKVRSIERSQEAQAAGAGKDVVELMKATGLSREQAEAMLARGSIVPATPRAPRPVASHGGGMSSADVEDFTNAAMGRGIVSEAEGIRIGNAIEAEKAAGTYVPPARRTAPVEPIRPVASHTSTGGDKIPVSTQPSKSKMALGHLSPNDIEFLRDAFKEQGITLGKAIPTKLDPAMWQRLLTSRRFRELSYIEQGQMARRLKQLFESGQ